jgi:hypothetical protein
MLSPSNQFQTVSATSALITEMSILRSECCRSVNLLCVYNSFFSLVLCRLVPRQGRRIFNVPKLIFSSPQHPDRTWGLRSFISKWAPGATSVEVRLQGREVDHSPPYKVDVKNGRAIASLPKGPSTLLVLV